MAGASEKSRRFASIDDYHAAFPEEVQRQLQQLRTIIHDAVPGLTEVISYNMPAFSTTKVLVYYAAYARHIGFYPTPVPIRQFVEELKDFKTSKGAIQFELGKALPTSLIMRIVRYRHQMVLKGSR